ncbi:MAG: histidinol dehydrogenase, partial [Nitrospirae bacterium]|nr:histidinol dehydrogenase [Nitrospirota bacterium]
MRIIKNSKGIAAFLTLLRKRAGGIDPKIEKRVRNIISDVKKRGDSAVKMYTKRFDRHDLPLMIQPSEIKRDSKKADKKTVNALIESARRIKRFHTRQKESSWSFKEKGALLGQIIMPVGRAGVYVPGGKASYPSTVLMNVIPAQVAGVKDILLCVPTPDGEINPAVMAAIDILGIKEVCRIGGAQAIASMAYGTETIRRVDKIAGPGNIYVATAKKLVFGDVDIDMIAGPSEILIIADDTANPAFIAADMLSQAEHDELASAVLLTDSDSLIEKVVHELNRQLNGLKRREIARKSLRSFGAVIKTSSIKEATFISNEIAPEHLEIMTKRPQKIAALIKNAGAIFLGEWTAEALGDYSAGPNHTLPTGGTARFSSPLGVYDFIKRTSLLHFSREGFNALSNMVELLADTEGL